MSTPTVVSKQTIQNLLFDMGVNVATAAVILPDPRYALPKIEWIAGEFATAFFAYKARELGAYAPGELDCDDFAREAENFAHRCYRRTPHRPQSSGFAFGQFFFRRNGTGYGHAINVAVCRDLDNLQLVFFEPQLAQLCSLSRAEIESCSYVGM